MRPIVLAAGASLRMGQPKALLDFDGARCLDLVVAACAGLLPPIVVVAPGSPVRSAAEALRAVVVENRRPEEGQTSSLRAGLAALAGETAFLIFPVDYPLVRPADVRALVDAFEARAPAQKVFIPSHGGRRGHPVLVDASLRAPLLALPPAASARDVLHADPRAIVHVERPDDRVVLDMDTPRDYARCLAIHRARGRSPV